MNNKKSQDLGLNLPLSTLKQAKREFCQSPLTEFNFSPTQSKLQFQNKLYFNNRRDFSCHLINMKALCLVLFLSLPLSSFAKEVPSFTNGKDCDQKVKNKKNCKNELCQCEKPKQNSCDKYHCPFPRKEG
jgi:hypothetical protein